MSSSHHSDASSTDKPSNAAAPDAHADSTSWVCIVMGVSGCGKSTVGEAAARSWNNIKEHSAAEARYVDGDDYHSAANISKMARGEPLTDADRADWLTALAKLVRDSLNEGRRTVIACSALKRSYRQLLLGRRKGLSDDDPVAACAARKDHADACASATPDADAAGHANPPAVDATLASAADSPLPRLFIAFLDGSESLLLRRMRARKNHFMKDAMLKSQLETLQTPTEEECRCDGAELLRLTLDDDVSADKHGSEIAEFIRQKQQA